jgi:acyl-[acyl-carrier-protein] desaturase
MLRLEGSMSAAVPEQIILPTLDQIVESELSLLKPIPQCWQPSDILPQMGSKHWRKDVEVLQRGASRLDDALLVVLAGNIVTEEALPSYQTWLNRAGGENGDQTGVSDTPWAKWSRGWTAEENRHGTVLSTYLYLSGRVDMRAVEVTIHHLLNNGFDLGSNCDPYRSLVYTSFQERATKISHANTGRLAEKNGDYLLAKICALVAADEARHEEAYKRFFIGALEIDAPRAVMAFADMMKHKIAMPARLMADGTGRDLFDQFALVAQRSGVYTVRDYAGIIDHLVDYWKIAAIGGLKDEAAEAQDYLCGLAESYLKKVDRIEEVIAQAPPEPFSWIHDRKA